MSLLSVASPDAGGRPCTLHLSRENKCLHRKYGQREQREEKGETWCDCPTAWQSQCLLSMTLRSQWPSLSALGQVAEASAQKTLGLTALTGELASWKQRDQG